MTFVHTEALFYPTL